MKTSRKGMLMAALICGTVAPVLFSGSAYAAEKEDVDAALQSFELNPMVITAQRTERSDLDTPAGTSIITAEDIERSGAKTAYEIIERQVGVVNKAYGPGGREYGGSASRITLRGLDKGTLVLVNGAPINLMNYNNTEGIPAQVIEKIEIVRGAQSAMYGAEAMAGVVNIITKKNGANKTTLSYGAGNYDQKWSVTTSGKNYMAYISKDYYGDVNQVNNLVTPDSAKWSLRDSTKMNTYISVSPIDKLSIQWARTQGKYYRDYMYRHNGVYEKYTKSKGVETIEPGKGIAYYYPETRDNISAVYDDKEHMFKSVLAYNRRTVDPRRGDIDNFKYGDMKWNYSSNWRLNSITWDTQKGWKLNGDKDTLIVGFDVQREEAKAWTKASLFGSGDRKTYALYASYNHKFSPKFETTLGLRGLHVNDYAKDQNKLLPQIQTLYKINDKTSWYINIGKAFQLPALNQYWNDNNPDLSAVRAQEGWTYETGLKVVNKANSWKFNIFHMDIDGKFDWGYRDPEDKTTAYLTNLGKWKNTGAELEYTQNFNDKLQMRFGIMYANPKAKADREKEEKGKETIFEGYYQDQPKFQFTAGVDYQIGKLTANLNYLFIAKQPDSYYNTEGKKYLQYGGTPRSLSNRSLLNANFIYRADKHHSMQLVLNNILDKKDRINEYENWGMPFNWMLTYNYTF